MKMCDYYLGNPQQALKDKGVIDSGCSRHMTGNISYLSDFEELNGGYVAFGGNPKGGKITGKGKIKTGKLDFDDVYYVKELKFNLFSVSQMCDKKNNVLFTDTECLVLSSDFKATLDESNLWRRRLAHINFKTMNKLVKGSLSTNTFSAAGPSNAVVSPTRGKSLFVDTSHLPDDPDMPELEDITYSNVEEDVGAEADFTNLEISITVSP
nr:hypothetical protein [Tanacetum cinerariifolium]